MAISTPACTHPPLPIHAIGVTARPVQARRPYATVIAQVDAQGHVTSVKIDDSSGDAGYDADALKAMQRWTFEPARANCNAIAGTAEYAVGHGGADFKDPCEHTSAAVAVVTPYYPEVARQSGIGRVEVQVLLSLDAAGRVISATVSQSSGNIAMDQASLSAALQSNYFPKVAFCLPQPSQYVFHVTFDPDG